MRFQEFAAQRWTQDDFDLLTEDEEAVLKMRRRGHSVVKTGDALNMSPESVHRRQRSIMRKLG